MLAIRDRSDARIVVKFEDVLNSRNVIIMMSNEHLYCNYCFRIFLIMGLTPTPFKVFRPIVISPYITKCLEDILRNHLCNSVDAMGDLLQFRRQV